MNQKSGQRTLLASVLLSAPGPLVLGLGLLVGRSSTQIADFVRRTAELVAIIISCAVFSLSSKQNLAPQRAQRYERNANLAVGISMCFGGCVMMLLALFTRSESKGNVVPALVIAFLGVITNSIFWFRYRKLNRQEANLILAAQHRLYRSKSLVDTCVTLSLGIVAVAPMSQAATYVDKIGSVLVALYLIYNGLQTIQTKEHGGTSNETNQS